MRFYCFNILVLSCFDYSSMPTNLFTQPLWRDEAFTFFMSIQNFWGIISATAKDFSPPFYYLFLHFWIKIFGPSEISLRTPSLIFFLLLVLTVYFLTKKLFNSKTISFLACFLTLFNPFLIILAFEVRMYTLLALLATMSYLFFWEKRWNKYLLITILGLYTHNFMWLVVISQLLVLCLKKQTLPKKTFFLLFLFYIPWLIPLFSQARQFESWIEVFNYEQVKETLKHLFIGPRKTMFKKYYFGSLAFLVIISLINEKMFQNLRQKLFSSRMILLLSWILTPIILTILVSLFKPMFLDRYLILIIPGINIGLAKIFAEHCKLELIKLLGLVFYLTCLSSIASITFFTPDHLPINQSISFLKNHLDENSIVINESSLNFFETKYYLRYNKPAITPKHFVLAKDGKVPLYVGAAIIEKNEIIRRLPEGQKYFFLKENAEIIPWNPIF